MSTNELFDVLLNAYYSHTFVIDKLVYLIYMFFNSRWCIFIYGNVTKRVANTAAIIICVVFQKGKKNLKKVYGKGTHVKHLSIFKDKKKNHSIFKNE